jgi:hypothetical protein
MQLGLVVLRVFPQTRTLHPLAGPVLYVLGFITALILWGFGLVWIFFAVVTISRTKRFPFNMGWCASLKPPFYIESDADGDYVKVGIHVSVGCIR